MFQISSFVCALSCVLLAGCAHSAPAPTPVPVPTPGAQQLSAADIAALTNNTGLADIIANGGDFTVYNETTNSNGTEKQLYVIKAVVYEVGILTETDDNSTESNESHERVDLTFFNAHKNGSHFDFGDLPVPIQANITGHTYTEILPLHIGDQIHNISDIASILPLPEHVLNFTQNQDTLFHYHSTPFHTHQPAIPEVSLDGQENVPLDEIPVPMAPLGQHVHVNADDLLKIPIIPGTLIVDNSVQPDLEIVQEGDGPAVIISQKVPLSDSSSSSSSEEQ